MPLLNIAVVGARKGHIPWTVVQVESGLTFVQLFQKILAGAHPMLAVDEYLSQSVLEKVFVGQSRESLSVVDESLVIDYVCLFGQHVKYVVMIQAAQGGSSSGSQTVQNAFVFLMNSQRSTDSKNMPSKKTERTKKDQLFNDIVTFFESKGWTWESGGESHGKQFVAQLQECLWYIDGHHQTLADRSHPIPSIFQKFSGYNCPELSKHRKRSHTNMNADILTKHASSLKSFLLSPWMKRERWATMRKAIEELTEAIEFYVFELGEKNRAMKRHHSGTCVEVASDDLAFHVMSVTNDYPIVLKPLVEELEGKGNYEPIFVRDFAPTDRRDRYT